MEFRREESSVKVSLVFGPSGAQLIIEPENTQDKALLSAWAITSSPGAVAEVSYGPSPFDVYGVDVHSSVVRVSMRGK